MAGSGTCWGGGGCCSWGLALFLAASLPVRWRPASCWLTAARVLQGLGGGGLMTTSQALVGEVVPPRERGRYQGYLASIFVASSTFGPVAGGWLTQHFGWQSVFLVNLPLGAVAALLALRLPRRPGRGGRLHFDCLGVVLFAVFITPMLLALERLQRFDPASLPLVGCWWRCRWRRCGCCCGRSGGRQARCCRSGCCGSPRSGGAT